MNGGFRYGFNNPVSATQRFAQSMREELEANKPKGNWLDADVDAVVQDLVYHVAKLVIAVQKDDEAAIHEYAADVANEAMIVADIKGVINIYPSPKPILLNEVLGIPATENHDLKFSAIDSGDGPNFKADLVEVADNFIKRVNDWAFITEAMKNAPVISKIDESTAPDTTENPEIPF